MSQPRGRLWVNPEGVTAVGDAYGEHVELYNQYSEQLASLRQRYANSWGDDDMGKAFSQKFLQGMDNLEGLIGGVRGTLDYTAEGLRESGKLYREADDDARETGFKMARDFDSLPATSGSSTPVEGQVTAQRSLSRKEMLPAETEGTPLLARTRNVRASMVTPEGEVEAPLMRGMRVQAAMAPLVGETTEPVEGETPRLRRAMTVQAPLAEVTPALPVETGEEPKIAYRSVRMQSAPLLEPATPTTPAISSYMAKPEYATAYVGGSPLPEGFRLQALNPFEDGSTRVDANLYDSLTPLGDTAVTTPDGRPIDAEGRQFFVVKESANVDPTAPGYQPLFLSYSADGTPTPLV